MSMWIDTLIQGVLLGGLYALYATGLSLIFGIMRLVNLAHGDLIVLATYLILLLATAFGLPILIALAFAVALMFALGYGLQRLVLNRTLGGDILPPLLVTFGLSIILQNALLEAFSADSRRLRIGPIESASIPLGGGIAIGVMPLLTFLTAVAVVLALQSCSPTARRWAAPSAPPRTIRRSRRSSASTIAAPSRLRWGFRSPSPRLPLSSSARAPTSIPPSGRRDYSMRSRR